MKAPAQENISPVSNTSSKKKKFRSLAISLAFALLGLGAFITLINNGLNIFFNFQKEQSLIVSSQNRIAVDSARIVREFIDEKLRILDQAADINDLATSPDRRGLVLNKLLGRQPSFRQLLLINNEGQEIKKISRLSNSVPIHLTAIDKDILLSTVHKKKNYTSAVYFDPSSQEPIMVLAVPAKNVFGDVEGAFIAEVNLKFMWDLVASIKIGNKGIAYVVDRQGNLLAFGDVSRILRRENLRRLKEVSDFIEGSKESQETIDIAKGIQGNYAVGSYAALGSPDWAVIVEVPVFEAYGTFIREIEISLLIMVVSMLSGIAVTIYIAREITRPIIKLTEAAKKIGEGSLESTIDVQSTNEIGVLASSFNQMTASLKKNINQLHDEQSKLSASISSLTMGFIMTDSDNNILVINQAARSILGTSPASPLSTVKECTLADIEEEFAGTVDLRSLINQSIAKKKILLVKEIALQARSLKIVITPIIQEDQAIGAVILVEDISEAKILERSRDEFFSIASHELRTPLTAIRGNTSLIQQYYGEKLKDPELAEMIEDIHESSTRLISIVNDFLDTSRLELGKMVFKKEEFDIIALIEDVIKQYTTTGSMKKLYLKFDPPKTPVVKVLADADRIRQVLINLIGNSLKFTEAGGITLRLTQEKGFIKVYVEDTGKGIPLNNQNLLFHKFQQAGSSLFTRDASLGTGLGLYISKMMLKGMGGDVKLEKSVEGKGTIFSATIPAAATPKNLAEKSETIPKA